jgi:Glycosyltransferase family 87
MIVGVALRTGVLGFGDYSDIVHLYRRDGLVGHPAPYFDYQLEYPVVTGAFVWIVGFVRWSAGVYFVASAAVLGALAVATVRMLERLPSTRPWLLAAAPAVAFWGVQNWDFLAIALLVAALLLHHRSQDAIGASFLALAVWAKFFPLVALPVVLVVRIAQRRTRAAILVAAVFVAVTVLVNAPVAIEGIEGGAVQLRDGWTFFFEYTHARFAEATLWSVLNVGLDEANLWSGVLLGVGLGVLVGLIARAVRHGRDVLLPAAGAALLWLLATGKVYSAQYSLWIFLALALAGLPLRAMITFAAIDVLLYVTLWGGLPWLGAPWPGTFLAAVRQGGTAVLAIWVMARIAAPTRDSPDGRRGRASPSVPLVFRARQRPRAGPA